jgi:hypothetical protein
LQLIQAAAVATAAPIDVKEKTDSVEVSEAIDREGADGRP